MAAFGKCRKCGARLSREKHAVVENLRTEWDEYTDDDGIVRREPRQAYDIRHVPCTQCGDPEPLNSWANNKAGLAVMILILACLALGIGTVFFF
jgi:hypothetical protein